MNELEKAIALNGHVATDIRMERRFSFGHKHPVLALKVRRQAGARHCRQAQSSISRSAIYVIIDFGGHQKMIGHLEQ